MNKNIKKLSKIFEDVILTHSKNIKTIFIHGSVAEEKESAGSYRQEMYYFKDRFLFSNFSLQNQSPDIDIIIVAHSAKSILSGLKKSIDKVSVDYFITINFISPEEYERVIMLEHSTAPKVLLIFKKTIVLHGLNYFKSLKKQALANKNNADIEYHQQFSDIKKLLSKNKDKGLKSVIINRNQYQDQFPLFFDMLEGKIIGGFSINRIKYIYPQPMNLKERIDIDTGKRSFLE